MTVNINPKLLDVVQLGGAPFKVGEITYGTVVELLGETPRTALIEVSDDAGVPIAFVHRAVEEVERIWNGSETDNFESSNKQNAKVQFERAMLYLQNGWYNEAKDQFFKSFSLDPNFRGALLNTTNELAAKGSFEPAIVVYTLLLELSPDYKLARENFAITQMNRAIILARNGLFPQAMESFLKALALNPTPSTTQKIHGNIVAAYTQLGLYYSNTKQFQLAFQCFQRAFELEPSEISRKNLAVAMVAVFTAASGSRTAEARLEMFREPLLMGLTLSECLTAYGATLATLGESDEAKRAFQAAIDIDPQNTIAIHDLDVVSARVSSAEIQPGFVPIESEPLEGIRL
jgi:tetratricopeptide (TPR) repeat protein